MDKQEYLNQISAKNRPPEKPLMKLLKNKFLWIGVGAVVILIAIAMIGSALGGNKTSGRDQLIALLTRIDNTNSVISEYQPEVKSSDLRSYSASLSSILSTTSSDLTTYMQDKLKFKKKEVPKKIADEETKAKTELTDELFAAKINGYLDRIYALKMAYEISIITTREEQILKSSKTESLNQILTSSHDSLENLYDKFDNFTGIK